MTVVTETISMVSLRGFPSGPTKSEGVVVAVTSGTSMTLQV